MLFIILLPLVVAYEPIITDYHERVGVFEAEKIRSWEEAVDFDGGRIVGGSPAALGAYPHLVSFWAS